MLSKALFVAALILTALDAASHAEPQQQLPLVKADMPYCFTIQNPPLLPRIDPANPRGRKMDRA